MKYRVSINEEKDLETNNQYAYRIETWFFT